MDSQVKWYGISLGLHVGLLCVVLLFAGSALTSVPPISIDFTLATTTMPERQQGAQQRADIQPQQPQKPANQPVSAQPKPVQQKQLQTTPQTVAAAAPHTAAVMPPDTQAVNAVSESSSGTPTARGAANIVTHSVSQPAVISSGGTVSSGQAQQRYRAQHFTYIRDLIMSHLTYPQLARRRGWSGRVVLGFVVAEDGSVRSIHVKEGSGYTLLDNSAVETVKGVAPFPKPPVAAEITMPVVFRLE